MSLTIRVMPADHTGCGFYRMIEPARVVAAGVSDVDVQYCFEDDEEGALELSLHGKLSDVRVVGVNDPQCDILIMQRPANRHLAEAIPYIQSYGTAVVCDYDDDFDRVDPRNPAWHAYEPTNSPMINKLWASLAAQLCDLVTVTTPALAQRYGSHGRVAMLPNYVPSWYLGIEALRIDERVRIGWAGNIKTHPGDLEVMQRALQTYVDPDRILFRTIGSHHTLPVVGLNAEDAPVEVEKWTDIAMYPYSLAKFDIGVVPLRDTAFNRAKSWLKGLELAAVGVPFVASPLQQYQALAALGAGDLVRSATPNRNAWRDGLDRLMDPEYRELRAVEGRVAASSLTYEKHAEDWYIAWTNALSMRRAT